MTKKSAELLKKLIMRGVSKFRQLFLGNKSRSEIVATFLAVLELCRLHSVEISDTDEDPAIKFIKVPEGTEEGGLELGAE